MPEMDGLTLATEIRQYRDPRTLPLVLFSSLGRRETGAEPPDLAALLTKPIKPSQLLDVLLSIFAQQATPVKEMTTSQVRIDPEMAQRLPLRILLAEDNAVNQKLALRLLQQMGYRADLAVNGLEALEALERQPYDVVLMDVQMPEMDGLEASRQINKRWSREERPHIIAMTANAMQGDREMCLAAGMDDYITKPVRLDELVGALTRVQPRARDGASAGAAPAIDRTAFENLKQAMGAEFIGELIDTFLEDTPKLLADMRRAWAERNADTFRRAAHSLKSNSANFGAATLSALSKELEMMGKAGELEGAEQEMARVEKEYERVKRELVEEHTGDK
jgi:CheY-like chemotaxis protein